MSELNPNDQAAFRALFVKGPEGLMEQGWTAKQVEDFCARPDIRVMLANAVEMYNDQEQVMDRVRYYGLSRLATLLPHAIDKIEATMKEQRTVVNEATGEEVIVNQTPFPEEISTAIKVLDLLNVDAKRDGKVARRDLSPDHLLRKPTLTPEEIEYDESVEGNDELEAMSRERIRNTIERMTKKKVTKKLVNSFEAKYDESAGSPKKKTTKKKSKKKTTKKTTKKKSTKKK